LTWSNSVGKAERKTQLVILFILMVFFRENLRAVEGALSAFERELVAYKG
jgi:hypothetical protein